MERHLTRPRTFELEYTDSVMAFIVTPDLTVSIAGKSAHLDIDDILTHRADQHLSVVPPQMQYDNGRFERQDADPYGRGCL
jgi:hypothetical protein